MQSSEKMRMRKQMANNCPERILFMQLLHRAGGIPQGLCGRCASRFFDRLHRNDAGILAYCEEYLCDMAENMPADTVQSRQACFVGCRLMLPVCMRRRPIQVRTSRMARGAKGARDAVMG